MDDRFEIYARIAIPRSLALGAEPETVGVFLHNNVNLNGTPFGYRDARHEHSAQFRSINTNRISYWQRLLIEFGL